jgi:hypothetical protein
MLDHPFVEEQCANPSMLVDGELWETSEHAPAGWGLGGERGTLTSEGDKGVFESAADGRQLGFNLDPPS